MSTKLKYFYVFIFSAVFTMLLFCGFYYMMLFNLMIHIPFSTDVTIKGLVVGFIGALIFSKLGFKGFIPFGWLGALVGLILTDFVFALTPYGSFYKESEYGMAVTANFLLMLIVSSVVYYILSKIIKIPRKVSEGTEEVE